jgi:glycogen debranching enzyme
MRAPVDDTVGEERISAFHIPATAAASSRGRRVLKDTDTLAVLDDFGNAGAADSPEGLFFEDTRHLSRLVLTVEGIIPLLLSSTVSEDNLTLEINLSNPDIVEHSRHRLIRDTVHIFRSMLVGSNALFETVTVHNFGQVAARFNLEIAFDADFVDLFEVRGSVRARRGALLPDTSRADGVVLAYSGLDGVVRRTAIAFDPAPKMAAPRRAQWAMYLQPGESQVLRLVVRCEHDGQPSGAVSREASFIRASARIAARKERTVDIFTTNEAFNDWLGRARADLDMLVTDTPSGLYPYAGIPWFSTAFGRDGLITALECLWLDPELAAGTLRFLAARQATVVDPKSDAEPGKILHETRKGEMAALGEVPFGLYYGSVDATPLFVVLASAYYARTGDLALIRALWPHIEAALDWMAKYGDPDHDGFLEYGRKSTDGLVNQGWKDSADAIFHADGSLAHAPIALAEVQAYAYAAYTGAAHLARVLDKAGLEAEFSAAAALLAERFDAAFWLDDLGTYALALDRAKRPCRVRASNAGHVLLGGLALPERASRVADTLMARESFTGWGIRTVAEGEARFSPVSYHNGSVWPHDNALITMGFARYGLKEPLLRVLSGLFDAASFMETKRMPELFCGFARRRGVGPTSYPVACIPQAWSSAAVFAMLGAALGVSFDARAHQIHLTRPVLPAWIDEMRLRNLRLGSASADLLLRRNRDAIAVSVTRRDGPIEVVLTT